MSPERFKRAAIITFTFAAVVGLVSTAAVVAVQSDAWAAGAVRIERGVPLTAAAGERPTLDIAAPKQDGDHPVVVFFPGGAWIRDGGGFRREIVDAALRGYVAVRVNYRLLDGDAGVGQFPSQIEDAQSAVRWLEENKQEFGADTSRMAFVGSSAGGHLALLAGLQFEALGLDGIVTFAAPTDLVAAYAYVGPHRVLLEALLGGSADEAPQAYHDASPINFVGPGAPPSLHFHGARDPRVPATQAEALAAAWEEVGGSHTVRVIPNQRHMLRGSARDAAYEEMYAFLGERLALETTPGAADADAVAKKQP